MSTSAPDNRIKPELVTVSHSAELPNWALTKETNKKQFLLPYSDQMYRLLNEYQ